MQNFCTLFDSNYLSRGIALYDSLKQHCEEFHLFIFTFDKESYDYLVGLELTHATVISLDEFEDQELLSVKNGRSVAEYCWTCTPSIILFSIINYDLTHCTYLDADLYFFNDPIEILKELADDSILLTEHRYSEDAKSQEIIRGKYCVQFMTFKSDANSIEALEWWRKRCIEWCFSYYEDGKFGDQMYLDDWLERFNGVHVMKNLGGGLAPWNMLDYHYFTENSVPYVQKKSTGRTSKLIFFHYHDLKLLPGDKAILSYYKVPKDVENIVYKTYLKKLLEIESKISPSISTYEVLKDTKRSLSLIDFLRKLRNLLKGSSKEYKLSKFLK